MKAIKQEYNEFNLAKAIAILGLPFVHFFEEAALEQNYLAHLNYDLANSVIFFTIFGPAVFMICMGFGISGNYSYKRLIKNGIQFLIIGYTLNFVIFTIPEVIYSFTTGDNIILEGIEDAFGADIYIFVGWAHIFYGLLKKYKVGKFNLLLSASVMLLLNNFTGHCIELPVNVFTQIIGNFISVNEQSYFPLAGWIIFVVVGILWGEFLKGDYGISYPLAMKRIFQISLLSYILFISSTYVYGIDSLDILIEFTQKYTMDIFTAFSLILISGIVITSLYFIYQHVRENFLERILLKLSSVIMSFYLIQWLLVSLVTYYGFMLFYDHELCIEPIPAALIMLSIFGLSLFISLKYGFTFLRFVIKKTDYTKWFKKKKTA